jgi:hypothetical protein
MHRKAVENWGERSLQKNYYMFHLEGGQVYILILCFSYNIYKKKKKKKEIKEKEENGE